MWQVEDAKKNGKIASYSDENDCENACFVSLVSVLCITVLMFTYFVCLVCFDFYSYCSLAVLFGFLAMIANDAIKIKAMNVFFFVYGNKTHPYIAVARSKTNSTFLLFSFSNYLFGLVPNDQQFLWLLWIERAITGTTEVFRTNSFHLMTY